MGKWIRLGVSVAVAGVMALIAVLTKSPVMFWLAPGILGVVHVVIWDVLKLDAFDKGIFRFLKLVALVGVYVILLLVISKESIGMINAELFSIDNTYTDLTICSITGAIGMLTFTFHASMACMDSFGNRNFGPSVAGVGAVIGLLMGLIAYFGGAISSGVAKFLAWVPVVITGFTAFSYIKENGLVYNDLPLDAGFVGFGTKGYSKLPKTGRPLEDAMTVIAWSESKYMSLYHNNNIDVRVTTAVYTYTIDFTISATVYSNSAGLTQAQANDVNKQINDILKSKQDRVLKKAKKSIEQLEAKSEIGSGFNVNVKVADLIVK